MKSKTLTLFLALSLGCASSSPDCLMSFEYFSAGDPPLRSTVKLHRDRLLVENEVIKFGTPIDTAIASRMGPRYRELLNCPFRSDLTQGQGIVDLQNSNGEVCSISMSDFRTHLGGELTEFCRQQDRMGMIRGFSLCPNENTEGN
jgi:hypothetical protein